MKKAGGPGGSAGPVALVLGGTVPHRALLENLRRRGYTTVLIDHLESPPAAPLADHHVHASTLDEAAVRDCALDHAASLVISTCVDQANLVACRVSHNLGLPASHSVETAHHVTNKVLMKRRLRDWGIPTSPFIAGTAWRDFEDHRLRYPLVVKPADSNGSKGVVRIDEPERLEHAVSRALRISRSHQAIVEEWIDGREVAFDSFILDGRVQYLLSRERRKITDVGDPSEVQQIFGSVWPAQIIDDAALALKQLAEGIAAAFEIDNSPLMVQAILCPDGLKVIEFAPRIGGAENHRIIPLATGLDAIDLAVDSWLGERPEVRQRWASEVFADLYIYAKPGRFGGLEGISELVDDGVALYGEAYKRTGDQVGADLTSFQRVGAVVVKGATEDEVLRRMRRVAESVRVRDDAGNDITRHDLLQFRSRGIGERAG